VLVWVDEQKLTGGSDQEGHPRHREQHGALLQDVCYNHRHRSQKDTHKTICPLIRQIRWGH
jgi:hypothetical protein